MNKRLPLLLFDVNETLLDLAPFAPVFKKMFGYPSALREWFDQVVVYSSAVTFAGCYANASVIGMAVLHMMAQAKGISLRAEDLAGFKRAATTQAIYPDVLPGLTALKTAGFRMISLSNNPTISTNEALHRNGVLGFFEQTFSIDDSIRQYKPALETYRWVAAAMSVEPADLCLVSCHAFDVLGAAAAGLRTAMILRRENAPVSLGQQPDLISKTLVDTAEALTVRYVS